MPRPRCQPGSGAARSEFVFPTKREGPARRRRHAMAAEALVPPDAARVAIRIVTHVATMYTNAPKRLRGGHFHRFVYTPASPRSLARSSQGATVYTNAPKRRGEARSSHLCTLLRSQPTHNPSPRPNSVHKRLKTAPRGHFGQSVYTPASSPGGEAHHAGVVTQSPTHTNSRSLNDQPD